jgi:hypothetical protein
MTTAFCEEHLSKRKPGWGTHFRDALKEAHWVGAVPGPQMRGTGGTHSSVMGRGHEKQKKVLLLRPPRRALHSG